MTRLRLGPILAAAAVVVALPRHIVAARFAAGLPAPIGPEWTATIDVSALSWAALEALVVFYLWRAYALARRRYLLGLVACVVFALAATNAPSLVADSLRIQLTELLPAAGPAHWSWAVASIGGNLLVVIAAGAADAAIDGAYLTTQVAELTDRVDKAAAPQVAVQDDAGLPGVGLQTFKVSVQTIGHYCAEAMTLLISRRVKLGGWSPALKWLPKDDQISTVSGLMITGAVDRLPNLHADWIREVNHLVMEHEKKLVRVTYLDRAGDPQYDVSAPAPSKADDTTLTISVEGKKPVTLTDQTLRDLPGQLRKIANNRQAARL